MIRMLLDQSLALMAGESARVNFTMTMWALGTMNFHPGQEYMDKMIDTLTSGRLIDKFDAQVGCPPSSKGVACHGP
jgi:hypothetical protein